MNMYDNVWFLEVPCIGELIISLGTNRWFLVVMTCIIGCQADTPCLTSRVQNWGSTFQSHISMFQNSWDHCSFYKLNHDFPEFHLSRSLSWSLSVTIVSIFSRWPGPRSCWDSTFAPETWKPQVGPWGPGGSAGHLSSWPAGWKIWGKSEEFPGGLLLMEKVGNNMESSWFRKSWGYGWPRLGI